MRDSIYPDGPCPVLVSLAPMSVGSGVQGIHFDLSDSIVLPVGSCCLSSEGADSRTSPIVSQDLSRRLQSQVGFTFRLTGSAIKRCFEFRLWVVFCFGDRGYAEMDMRFKAGVVGLTPTSRFGSSTMSYGLEGASSA